MIETKQIERPKLILIADDIEINQDALEVILEEDYHLLFAENGKEALEMMYSHKDDLSMLLLDLNMPLMNGYEVLEHIRQDEQLQHIPVIVLTADKSAELRALQLGAADFITKPFDIPEIILTRVDRILELSEGKKLISAAETERLTGLYTRNFFFEYAWRLYRYHSEMHMDAIVINIEQFHSINAVNGRGFGDSVLKLIGDEIRTFLAGTQGIASRVEADRFDVYCLQQNDYRALLDRFQEAVNRYMPNVSIHLRMGVMPWREEIDPVVMFDRAQAACNMVRGDYQNPLMIYNEELHSQELMTQRLLNDLNSAITEHQLKVYYQPKYDIQCVPPRLFSAEALIRWRHPELGMISPGDFVPLFERSGQIAAVDRYVWAEVARQIAEWRDRLGVTLPVSVNLSRVDVFDPDLFGILDGIVAQHGLDRGDLKLEVTESAYTENADHLIRVIGQLREKGYKIEMDDFGSGYSSLNMLSSMPIDVLKMDMAFIRNIERNERDFRLVELIIDIARYLKVPVVAEGVETENQLRLLRNAGCDLVQGYYFSPPLCAAEFEEKMLKSAARD